RVETQMSGQSVDPRGLHHAFVEAIRGRVEICGEHASPTGGMGYPYSGRIIQRRRALIEWGGSHLLMPGPLVRRQEQRTPASKGAPAWMAPPEEMKVREPRRPALCIVKT